MKSWKTIFSVLIFIFGLFFYLSCTSTALAQAESSTSGVYVKAGNQFATPNLMEVKKGDFFNIPIWLNIPSNLLVSSIELSIIYDNDKIRFSNFTANAYRNREGDPPPGPDNPGVFPASEVTASGGFAISTTEAADAGVISDNPYKFYFEGYIGADDPTISNDQVLLGTLRFEAFSTTPLDTTPVNFSYVSISADTFADEDLLLLTGGQLQNLSINIKPGTPAPMVCPFEETRILFENRTGWGETISPNPASGDTIRMKVNYKKNGSWHELAELTDPEATRAAIKIVDPLGFEHDATGIASASSYSLVSMPPGNYKALAITGDFTRSETKSCYAERDFTVGAAASPTVSPDNRCETEEDFDNYVIAWTNCAQGNTPFCTGLDINPADVIASGSASLLDYNECYRRRNNWTD